MLLNLSYHPLKSKLEVLSNIDHYKEFRKNPYVEAYILPTWSYEEMVDCCDSLTKYQQVDLNHLREMGRYALLTLGHSRTRRVPQHFLA